MDELPPRVLLVELSPDRSPDFLRNRLLHWGVDVAECSTADWLREASALPWPTLLWLGRHPCAAAPSLCRQILARPPNPALVVLDRELAEQERLLCDSCSDFVRWPVAEDELRLRLVRLWPGAGDTAGSDGVPMVGQGHLMQAVRLTSARFAACDAPVLIQGETGTGKELAARTIHYLSSRRDHPFIPVNCGAIPADLIENELFGHQPGAYTDARRRQPGLVEQADGGTLFLDEVGTLGHRAQCALLRFMQNREYRRLGGGQTREANVRVVAASNAELTRLIDCKEFRADLYFRLDILNLRLPPLRQRPDDIPALAEHFLRRFRVEYNQPRRRLAADALTWLGAQPWPGNVRELENALRRAFLLSDGALIGVGALAPWPEAGLPSPDLLPDFRDAKEMAIASFERDYLQRVMRRAAGNVTRAADLAGKERRTLGKLLKKHGLNRRDFG